MSQNQYDDTKIKEIREEIERQWSLHLISRAAFPSKIKKRYPKYKSPPYYSSKGIELSIEYNYIDQNLLQSLDGIGHWLNQNFVIRLFGILNEHNVDVSGKIDENEFTKIVAYLRQKVGAHSKGKRNPQNAEAKEVTNLLRKHFDEGIDRKDVEQFNLTVNTVLYGLKDECISYVESLKGKPIPSRGQREW